MLRDFQGLDNLNAFMDYIEYMDYKEAIISDEQTLLDTVPASFFSR